MPKTDVELHDLDPRDLDLAELALVELRPTGRRHLACIVTPEKLARVIDRTARALGVERNRGRWQGVSVGAGACLLIDLVVRWLLG